MRSLLYTSSVVFSFESLFLRFQLLLSLLASRASFHTMFVKSCALLDEYKIPEVCR